MTGSLWLEPTAFEMSVPLFIAKYRHYLLWFGRNILKGTGPGESGDGKFNTDNYNINQMIIPKYDYLFNLDKMLICN